MATKKRKKRLLNKFIQVFLTTFALLMIVIGIGTIIYVVVAQQNVSKPTETSNYSLTDYPEDKVVDGKIVPTPFGDKKLTTFAIFGVDKDGFRTDVTMIAFFNHETAKVDLISVPRDTQVKIPDEIYETIQARRSDVNQIVKINEVPAYIIDDRNETSVSVLEQTLGIDIDYYVNMKLDVFKYIVNEIGEVPMNVPIDMEYIDPNQDLYIKLSKGQQTLNGDQAEQLIRFRSGYGNADIGRIEMQHEFMKAFAQQLLTTKNRLNMVNIITSVMVKVDTNFNNAVDYLVYLDQISADSFEMHRLPGEVDNSSRSYYIYDYDQTKALFNEIINKPYNKEENEVTEESTDGTATTPPVEETVTDPVVDVVPEIIIDVKNMKISVQNGTNVGGFAGSIKDKLSDNGFKVQEAVNYKEKGIEDTVLYVPAQEAFDELEVFFNSPKMVVAPDMMDEDIQIIVVLGNSDAPQ